MSFDKVATLRALSSIPDTFENESDRQEISQAVQSLSLRLKAAWEIAAEHCYFFPLITAVLRTCLDLGLFKAWVDKNGGEELPEDEVHALVKADPVLMRRLLRVLSSFEYLSVPSEGHLALTPYTKKLAEPTFASYYSMLAALNGPGYANLPGYLKSIDYVSPSDPSNTNWHHLTGQGIFPWMAEHPQAGLDFQIVIKSFSTMQPRWTEVFPSGELLIGAKEDRPVFVDVGGGLGHDVEDMRVAHPDVPKSQFVLQDTPETVGKTTADIEAQAYDFMTPQPVKGARAYHLRRVLHDWPDQLAVNILKNQVSAMERGYSQLLIREQALNGSGKDSPMAAVSDVMMMMGFSAKERTEHDWRELCGKADLNVVEVRKTKGPEAVLVCELSV